jgi:hypothetical protein
MTTVGTSASSGRRQVRRALPPTLLPAMSGPLAANPKPMQLDAGPLGSVYVTGVASGFAQWQNNVAPEDRAHQADVDNAQIFINKPTGLAQFFRNSNSQSRALLEVGLLF